MMCIDLLGRVVLVVVAGPARPRPGSEEKARTKRRNSRPTTETWQKKTPTSIGTLARPRKTSGNQQTTTTSPRPDSGVATRGYRGSLCQWTQSRRSAFACRHPSQTPTPCRNPAAGPSHRLWGGGRKSLARTTSRRTSVFSWASLFFFFSLFLSCRVTYRRNRNKVQGGSEKVAAETCLPFMYLTLLPPHWELGYRLRLD